MRVVIVVLSIMSVMGCGKLDPTEPAEEDLVKASVRANMKDPDSAKFGKVSVIDMYACSTVNGKNAFGGYTGDQIAYSIKSESGWITFDINNNITHEACVGVMTKQAKKEK